MWYILHIVVCVFTALFCGQVEGKSKLLCLEIDKKMYTKVLIMTVLLKGVCVYSNLCFSGMMVGGGEVRKKRYRLWMKPCFDA